MKRILIIEDEPLIAAVYSKKFGRRGFVVEAASDGVVGLQKVAEFKPDVLLLDIMMPRMDGLEVLRRIRAAQETRDLPVVMYSNWFSPTASKEARQLGASHLLSKTESRPDEIVKVIAELLKVSGVQPEATPDADRAACLKAAQDTATELRAKLKEIFKQNEPEKMNELCEKAHTFGKQAWVAGLQRASHLASALEVLVGTLRDHPQYSTFSTDKTMLQAIECVQRMALTNTAEPIQSTPSILVVDDQEIALKAATFALKKAKLNAVCTPDPQVALAVLAKRDFDLVLLDIDMPNVDGMKLCSFLRAMPRHAQTPVVFFSQLSDLGHRLESVTVGGNDFIGKPFLPIELTVKALVWLFTPTTPMPV